MKFNQDALKVLLGMKLKQFRQSKGLSLKEVTALSGVSTSYLNEIESGKKFPTREKLLELAEALKIPVDDLLNFNLGESLGPLMKFLKSNILQDLPLDIFGISSTSLLHTISKSPNKFSAFIKTLMQIARTYDVEVEDFYMAALRSYRETHNNFFPKIEDQAVNFLNENALNDVGSTGPEVLAHILQKTYKVKIENLPVKERPMLKDLRSLYRANRQKKLLVNPLLNGAQRSFILAKELGHQVLGHKKRPDAAPALQYNNFEEVLNDFFAGAFAEAILLPRQELLKDINELMALEHWSPDRFYQVLARYNVHPEALFHRLTNIFTEDLKIEKLFYLRMDHDQISDSFSMAKELHLGGIHRPHGIGLKENYCRRWVSLKLLKSVANKSQYTPDYAPLLDIQRVRFDGGEEYFVFAMARQVQSRPSQSTCIAIGMQLTEDLLKRPGFWNSPDVPLTEVGDTCERCGNLNCSDRAASPRIFFKQKQGSELLREVQSLQ